MPRLRRSDTNGPGFRRVKSGKGFRYTTDDGDPVDDATRERVAALVIPPAWTDVWIAPYPNGHIQATGVDAAGRRQYMYHPAWREQKDGVKYDRALELAETLPTARRGVTIDLRRDDLSRERVLAGAFRMLDTGSLRVGSERYAAEHGSFGLSTLLCAHAIVTRDDKVELKFPAKSGQEWESDIRDPDLAALVRRLKRRGPNARLLAWKDERGWHPLTAEEINEDVRRRTGGAFTAKDFRTLHGTAAAAVSLAKTGPRETASGRKRAIVDAVRAAADDLNNTPAIARGSYVDPRVLDAYEGGVTIDPARTASVESELRELLGQ
ncbi:MAG TPA: DNA topoisomerase IB [Pseudolysinimonas sp.]|nr:DNA topoisomerase IB [Pseudolysinimonas sp.]